MPATKAGEISARFRPEQEIVDGFGQAHQSLDLYVDLEIVIRACNRDRLFQAR